MPSFYRASPFAAGLSNLAQALFPDPVDDVRAGLMGEQRRLVEAQRSRLDSEMLAEETQLRESDAMDQQFSAELAGLVGQLSPELQQQGRVSAAALRSGVRGSNNANANMGGVRQMLEMLLAQGGDTQQRASGVMQGREFGPEFAGTAERADAVAGRNATADRSLQGVRNAGAFAERRLMEDGANSRNAADIAGKLSIESNRAAAGGGGGGGGVLPMIGGSQVESLLTGIQDAIASYLPEGQDLADLPPATQQQLLMRASELAQQTRNEPLAISQAVQELFGGAPQFDVETKWFGNNQARVKPPAAGARPPLSSFQR